MTYRPATETETLALQAFADEHGRNWRRELSDVYWYNARLWRGPEAGMGSELHGIRNDLGPKWLYDVCKVRPARKAAGL
jgi:hypothetical protein